MNQQPQGTRNGVHGDNGATFEQSFGRLQEVVQKLSAGSMTLQEALSAFEEGMALADRCTQLLDSAELRIQQVSARAARAGAEAANEIESRSKLAGNQPELPVIDVETFE